MEHTSAELRSDLDTIKTHQEGMKLEVPKTTSSSKTPTPKGSPMWRNKFIKGDKTEKADAAKSVIKRCKSIGKTYEVQLYGVLAKKVDKKNRPTRFVKR